MAKAATASTRPNFGSLLDKRPDEIEKPKPLPEGSYLWVVQGMPRMDKSSKKQTEFVEFTLKCLQAGDDVDKEALAEILGDKSLGEVTQRATYYLTDNSLWRLKEFLEHCGIDMDESESLRIAIEETPNCQVVAFINHEPSQDGSSIFARLGKTALAEDFNAGDDD